MTTTEAALPRMLTAKDVQLALGGEGCISMKTIRRRAKDKTIPGAIWIGSKLYFQELTIMAWIQGGATAAILPLRRVG